MGQNEFNANVNNQDFSLQRMREREKESGKSVSDSLSPAGDKRFSRSREETAKKRKNKNNKKTAQKSVFKQNKESTKNLRERGKNC